MGFYPGLEIKSTRDPIGFVYGEHTFGPKAEVRRLADIRNSLEDKGCQGPEELYAIVMDVGEREDKSHMEKRNLLFGAVTYSAGAGPLPGPYPQPKPFLRMVHTGGV